MERGKEKRKEKRKTNGKEAIKEGRGKLVNGREEERRKERGK